MRSREGWLPGGFGTLLMGTLVLLALSACQRAASSGDAPPRPERPEVDIDTEAGLADWARDDAGEELDELPGPPEPEDEAEADADPLLYSAAAGLGPMDVRTRSWIHYWQTRGSEHFARHLERMPRFEAMVDEALEEFDLPPSLRYLPIVESGYNPNAVSRVGATGLWQLMHGTALDLGLEVGPLVDERRDPVRSTQAALTYLELLHDQFDSWFLALAAYNAGRGQVGRILERHAPGAEPSDSLYLVIRDHLPAETQEFVPRFFAAARLASDPESFGFDDLEPQEALAFDEVEISGAASLDVLAEAADIDARDLEELNPQLRRGYTPDGGTTVIRAPEGRGGALRQAYASLPPEERVSFRSHFVESGETLTHIARTHGVGVDELRAANPGVDPSRLQIGQELVVPAPGTPAEAVAAEASDENPTGEEVVHLVREGESLWSVARQYGVTVDDLRSWNGLAEGAVLRVGDELRVANATVATHEVASGETLGGIALQYGISVQELASENGISTDDILHPGQELRIPLGACPTDTRRC